MPFIILALFVLSVSPSQTVSKQNILFIVVDDLRPSLGCYNDENAFTPNIDKLAQKSFVFNNAFVQQALCAPSRTSFLTSRRPDTLHLYDFYSYWRTAAGNFTTIPQYFKDNGYHTMSIGKVFHPGISSNGSDDQPYSWSEKPFHPPTEQFKEAPVCPNQKLGTFQRNLICPVIVKFQPGKSLPDLQILEKAKQFVRVQREKPFFLAVGFHKPHVPLKFPREFLSFHPLEKVSLAPYRWRPPGLPPVAWNPWTDLREREDVQALNLTFPYQPVPDDFSKLIRQSYYASVTYIDDLIGQLLSELKLANLLRNTTILLVGDHGWSMGENGEWSKYSNSDIAVRVPFILHIPRKTKSGVTREELVELVDVFPTLVDIGSLSSLATCPDESSSVPLCTEGTSLVPLLDNRTPVGWKTGAFSQYPRPTIYPSRHPNSDKPRLSQIKIMGYSLRTRRHRFTEWVHFDVEHFRPIWSNVVGTEVYDVLLDPGESNNLYGREEMKNITKELRVELRLGWRYSLPPSMNIS